jgi:hypothetical protein
LLYKQKSQYWCRIFEGFRRQTRLDVNAKGLRMKANSPKLSPIAAIFLSSLAGVAIVSGQALPLSFESAYSVSSGVCQFVGQVPNGAVCVNGNRINLSFAAPDGARFTGALRFQGARRSISWEPSAPGGFTTRLGGNSGKPSQPERHYGKLTARNIYPGIDAVLYGSGSHVEYDLLVSPGADPRLIRLAAEGGQFELEGERLVVRAGSSSLLQHTPVAYQSDSAGGKVAVPARYRLISSRLAAFSLGEFDPSRTLVIDPVIDSAGMFGGSGTDRVIGGDSGRSIVGNTTSVDFPGVTTARHQNIDVFIYTPGNDSTLIIGGSGDDIVTSVAANSNLVSPVLIIGGYTNSRDLTAGIPFNKAAQPQYGGGAHDGFYIEWYAGQVTAVSYFGGSGDDRVLTVSPGFAIGGSTDSPDLPLTHAWQTTPGGGLDGFFALVSDPIAGLDGSLKVSTYLGGSEDERVLAVTGPSGLDSTIYLAGDSRSNDWQLPGGWTGQRQGPSDGFLIRTQLPDRRYSAGASANGVWLGGTADDRATALATLSNGDVVVAGVSASADFSVMGVPPPAYHGGDSDAFLAKFSGDLVTAKAALLIGGSGAEEPLGIAVNTFNEVLLGGWTSSADLAVSNPFQGTFGGGASDGFLYYVDGSFNVLMSTFIGGPGSDRISFVNLDQTSELYFSGDTDGASLPFPTRTFGTMAGSFRGFWGTLSLAAIHADGMVVGKDLAGTINASLGDPTNVIGVPLTVSSTNPQALLIAEPGETGQASVIIAHGVGNSGSVQPAVRVFHAECLTDSAIVEVDLSAPGYPNHSIQVQCSSSALAVTSPSLAGGGQSVQTFNVYPAVLDPVTQKVIAGQPPRSGVMITVNAQSQNPAFAALDQASTIFNSDTPASGTNFLVRTSGSGATDVSLSTDSALPFVPSASVHIVATAAGNVLSLYPSDMAKDVVGGIFFNYPPPPTGTTITFTTSDPGRALLGLSYADAGQSSVTVTCTTYCPQPLVMVLDDSGPVNITAGAPGYSPVAIPLSFGFKTAAFFDANGQKLSLAEIPASQTLQARLRVYVKSPSYNYPQPTAAILRAGGPAISLALVGNDTSIAVPSPMYFGSQAGASMDFAVSIKGVAAGTTTFSATSSGANIAVEPLTVKVDSLVPQADPVTVGKLLEVPVVAKVLGSGNAPLTITSSDPSRAVVSADAQTPGTASVTLAPQRSDFIVQALADSGQVSLALDAAGQHGQMLVTLAPSGIEWAGGDRQDLRNPNGSSASMAAYYLDPGTLTPLGLQRPAPSGATVNFVSSDPTIALVNSTPLSSPSWAIIQGRPGEADISIVQPPGFVTPVGSQPLHVIVGAPSYSPVVTILGKNLQTPIGLSKSTSRPNTTDAAAITISSGDPTKLLFSLAPTDPPMPSVTWRTSGSSPGFPVPIYAHALDGPVDVKLTASADGFADGSSVVSIQKSWVAIGGGPGVPAVPVANVNTQSDLQLPLAAMTPDSYGNPAALSIRSGLGPLPINVVSSAPDVAAVQSAPILLNTGVVQTNFHVTPIAAGQATLSVVQPAGFSPPPAKTPGTTTVNVAQPTWALPNLTIGQDLRTSTTLSLQNGAFQLPSALDVTLTASDPTLVGLSINAASSPSGSIVVHMQQGQQPSAIVYVTSFAATGTAQIQVSAPGYGSSTAQVTLVQPTLVTQGSPFFNLPASASSVQLYLAPQAGSNSNAGSYALRTGAPDYVISAASSDPTVFAPVSSQFTLHAGDVGIALPLRLAGPGNATLILQGPPGFAGASIAIAVQGGNLFIGGPGPLGMNLEGAATISSVSAGTPVTITSADPSRVLLSASSSATGQSSITVVQAAGQTQFWVQALAGSGTVTLNATAPGYQNAQIPITLAQSEVVFIQPQLSTPLTPASAPLSIGVTLRTPAGNNFPQTLRPGAAPLSVSLNSTNSTVGSVSPAVVVFNPGDSKQTITFQPHAAGSTLLSLGIPPGFTDPVADGQVFLTVLPSH